MLYTDICKEFLIECEFRGLSNRTLKTYRCHLRLFKKFLEKSDIFEFSEINDSLIKRFILSKKSKDCKISYLNGLIKTLNSFYNYCEEEGYSENFAKKVKFLRNDSVLIKTFTDDEVKRMLSVYSGRDFLSIRNRLIIAILFDTGIRNFELCGIRNSDVKESFVRIFGKGRKERVVPITPYVKRLMVRYERERDKRLKHDDGYFLSRTGRSLTIEMIENIVRRAGKEARVRTDIRCSPHTCRHYYAQSCILNGTDIYTVSRLLGHSNIGITQTYIKSMMDSDILEIGKTNSPLMNL